MISPTVFEDPRFRVTSRLICDQFTVLRHIPGGAYAFDYHLAGRMPTKFAKDQQDKTPKAGRRQLTFHMW